MGEWGGVYSHIYVLPDEFLLKVEANHEAW